MLNTTNTLKVLLIEDNHDFVSLLSLLFELFGCEISAAYDGNEGIEKAAEVRPDIIFCDIGLPGMNGYDIARRIKGNSELRKIYMIALTGYSGKSDIEMAFESGFNRHVSKPVDIASLELILFEAKIAAHLL